MARINEARVTSEQRRNVMASRKLAQQRVLRIMQEQTAEHPARGALERAAEAEDGPAPRTLGAALRNSQKRDL
jgi:hypothetical protein